MIGRFGGCETFACMKFVSNEFFQNNHRQQLTILEIKPENILNY